MNVINETPESAYSDIFQENLEIPFKISKEPKPKHINKIYYVKKPVTDLEKYIYQSHINHRKSKPALKRGLGFNPINDFFPGSSAHHLHLEGNKNFIIYIPSWAHHFYSHNTKSWAGMDSINSFALSFWLIDSELFTDI